MGRATTKFFPLLDGIRGVASLLVVMRHTAVFFQPFSFQESYLAVDVFFLLSGVVLCNAYEERLRNGMKGRQFCRLRVLRIYPLYLLGLLGGTLATLWWPHGGRLEVPHLWLAVAFALFLLPYPLTPSWIFPLNGPSWSLLVELVGNAVYGLTASRLRIRLLVSIVAAGAVGLVVVLLSHGGHDLNAGYTLKGLFAGFVRYAYSYFAGVAIYRRYRSRAPAKTRSRLVPWLVLAVIASLLMLSPSTGVQPYYDFVVVTLCFPLLIYAALLTRPDPLTARICTFFGAISYAVYALHEPLSRLVVGVLGSGATRHAPWSGLLFVAFLVALCWLIDRTYDAPVRRWLLQLTGTRLRVARPAGEDRIVTTPAPESSG
jgi:peptidoglycan/LPS O-acetylase OafA/YrhL